MGLSNDLQTSADDKRTCRNVGLLLVILAQVFGVGMNTCVKLLQFSDPPVPPFEIVFVRQIITYSVSLYFLIRQGVPYPGMCLTWASLLRSFILTICISYWSTRSTDVVGFERHMRLLWYSEAFYTSIITFPDDPTQDSSGCTTAFSISHSPMPLQ